MRGWHWILVVVGVAGVLLACAGLWVALPWGPGDRAAGPGGSGQRLVLYSGRSRSLVQPLIDRFRQETGIRVEVRPGPTAQLAATLREEGGRSPADVFWAQESGALAELAQAGRLAELPEGLIAPVASAYRGPQRRWVGTSGRARVLAYSSERVAGEALPTSVDELTDERFAGRVGWAPTNASFQAFVTAMRHKRGDEATRRWLVAMRQAGTRAYANNTAIIQAIAAGEVDFGLTNHYYLHRFHATDPDYPVNGAPFAAGDIGNLMLTSSVAILEQARNAEAAQRFVAFLLEDAAQRYFLHETFEYPVTDVSAPEGSALAPARQRSLAPQVTPGATDDIEGTLRLLRQAGVL